MQYRQKTIQAPLYCNGNILARNFSRWAAAVMRKKNFGNLQVRLSTRMQVEYRRTEGPALI